MALVVEQLHGVGVHLARHLACAHGLNQPDHSSLMLVEWLYEVPVALCRDGANRGAVVTLLTDHVLHYMEPFRPQLGHCTLSPSISFNP